MDIVSAGTHYYNLSVWDLIALVVMPDHVHLVITRCSSFANSILNFKHWISRKYNVRWQQDFFEHRLRNKWQLEEKVDYVLNNPVRQGLVNKQQDWPYTWCQ